MGQLRQEGWFHNYMRMLWGKKILEWSRTPQEALASMIAIMNRWSLDGRNPTQVSVDGVGRFANRVGTFFADDSYNGKPVRVRGTFAPLTASSAQWEQAYSSDGGRTWETNYVMLYTR